MSNQTEFSPETITKEIHQWLDQVVIGLNLCPFASAPYKKQHIRIEVTDCDNQTCLVYKLEDELKKLAETPVEDLETTLLVIPETLHDFYDYNDFLDIAESIIEENDYMGVFQIASFHPKYQFAGTKPGDNENLTNRAPYPILHLLREESLEKAVAHYANPEEIPGRNIETVEGLSEEQKVKLFPYLFKQTE